MSAKINFGVVTFPGSNCDADMVYVLQEILEQNVTRLWHKDNSPSLLKNIDAIMLPGGFSYGDYLRAGALARYSPIMPQIMEFAEKGGFVMGICNGFQILCETHLLPGALLPNANQKFVCKNVFIKADNNQTSITTLIDASRSLKIPVAHADGLYYVDDQTLVKMRENKQILFRYCDKNGLLTREANPNGALENIAGICNAKRNVFGMMPHPERCSDNELGNIDGKIIFESIIKTFSL